MPNLIERIRGAITGPDPRLSVPEQLAATENLLKEVDRAQVELGELDRSRIAKARARGEDMGEVVVEPTLRLVEDVEPIMGPVLRKARKQGFANIAEFRDGLVARAHRLRDELAAKGRAERPLPEGVREAEAQLAAVKTRRETAESDLKEAQDALNAILRPTMAAAAAANTKQLRLARERVETAEDALRLAIAAGHAAGENARRAWETHAARVFATLTRDLERAIRKADQAWGTLADAGDEIAAILEAMSDAGVPRQRIPDVLMRAMRRPMLEQWRRAVSIAQIGPPPDNAA